MKYHNQQTNGDTIVEVLVAMAVVGVILAGAFVTINRNIRNVRGAQERGEALQSLQGQLEGLRSATTSVQGLAVGTAFCMNSATPPAPITGFTGGIPANQDADGFGEYPSGCNINTNEPIYHISIVKTSHDTSSNTDVYILRIRWLAVDFAGNDEVELEYKI